MPRNFAERPSKNLERFLRTTVRRRTGRARIEALNEASHESNPVRYGGPLIQASVRLVRSNGELERPAAVVQ